MSTQDSMDLTMKVVKSQISQLMLEAYYEGRAEGIEIGVSTEQERIIKLLDEALIYDEPVVIERDRLIPLIKGEQK